MIKDTLNIVLIINMILPLVFILNQNDTKKDSITQGMIGNSQSVGLASSASGSSGPLSNSVGSSVSQSSDTPASPLETLTWITLIFQLLLLLTKVKLNEF